MASRSGLAQAQGVAGKPKLLDQLRAAPRSRHYSSRTEQAHCLWVKRFVFFHGVRHHQEMAEAEINAFLAVLKAGIVRRVGCHTFRPSFATHLLEDGCDIRTFPELLGHKDAGTTMICTHVLNKGGRGLRSPILTGCEPSYTN